MSRIRHWLTCLGAVPMLTAAATALEWQTRTQSFTTSAFQTTQEAIFEFRNSGTKPVTILDLETNCDCLETTADKKTYAPGAVGTIKARFAIADRLGVYERTIRVVADEPGEPAQLLMRIEVPEVVRIFPRSVEWKINGAADERTIDLQAATGLEIVFTDAEATSSEFSTVLETLEPGRHYRVHLKVRSTAQPANTAIRLYGRGKSGATVLLSAYGIVQ